MDHFQRLVRAQQLYDTLQDRWDEELEKPQPDWGFLSQLHLLIEKVEQRLAALEAEES